MRARKRDVLSIASRASDRLGHQGYDALLLVLLAVLSLGSLFWYYAHNDLLLYGDAVAHLNIARRVIDNRSWLSSFFQLGTVWLPLQHVAMLPFVWNDRLWQSGIAGAIPSMIAYALGGMGIFRLVSGITPTLRQQKAKDGAPLIPTVSQHRGEDGAATSPTLRQPRAQNGALASNVLPACVATAIYALNPSLLYMQATAMNEPSYIAFFIWSVVYLQEMLRANAKARDGQARQSLTREQALERCGICLAGAAYTRYDGWFAGAVIGAIVVVIVVRWLRNEADGSRRRALAKSLLQVLLLNALVPVFWLSYNLNGSGKAMDWANGPYSAKAIAQRTTKRDAPPYPGKDHPITAGRYFLRAAQLNMGGESDGRSVLVFALAGTALGLWRFRRCWVWLLLWLPLIFYSFSIAYGSVPIFIPVWWPFSYYNVRYGLELLPAFAVFPVLFAANLGPSRVSRVIGWGAVILMVSACYFSSWAEPITLREAKANSQTRLALEDALANFLARLPKHTTLLMYEGSHVGALQRAGIPLKNVISEVSHPDWEWALLDPAHKADYIVACQGDAVWSAARQNRSEVTEVQSISVPGQERCTIYVPSGLSASPQTP